MKIKLTTDLGPLMDQACLRVDTEAEAERAQYVTPGALQAATYTAKKAEAIEFLAKSGEGDFPILTAEAAATGASIEDLAATVVRTATQWTMVMAAIEGKRLGAKSKIRVAKTPASIEAAAVVDWTL